MVIVGVVLLLPGLCALMFGAGSLFSSSYDSGFTLFILFGLLVGFGGGHDDPRGAPRSAALTVLRRIARAMPKAPEMPMNLA